MTLDEACLVFGRRVGLTYAQNKDLFEKILSAVVEEIGLNIDIPRAQTIKVETIAAGGSSILNPSGTGVVKTVQYCYTTGSSEYKKHLNKSNISEFRAISSGLQGTTSDTPIYYCVFGTDILIGPYPVTSGGSIEITFQRQLILNDIELIPGSEIIIAGAEANYWPTGDPKGDSARAIFISKLNRTETAFIPTRETYNQRMLDPQMAVNMANIRSLKQ
jgi:hypothetical protein